MTMLREQAYIRFKEILFAGNLRPGQFVSQRELTTMTGVSAGPMREALKRLETEAFVLLIPQVGVQIADVNIAFIRNAFQLRITLEVSAVRHFAAHATEDEIAALEESTRSIIAAANRAPSRQVLDEALVVDWRMHDALINSLGNPLIAEIHRVNSEKIRLIRLNCWFTPERVVPAMEEHLAILTACRARRSAGAARSLERHLETSRRRAMGS